MPTGIKLIVGLGNPGSQYTETRHNAGFRFLDRLLSRTGASMRAEKKFDAETGSVIIAGEEVKLLAPQTFMNLSGQSVQRYAQFYKISLEQILVAHDDLDLPPGTVRLKQGGGAGGHNGLKDIMQRMGKDFFRLRIGIGHPGQASQVASYVLKRAPADEQNAIDAAIESGVDHIEDIVRGEHQRVMNQLHTK